MQYISQLLHPQVDTRPRCDLQGNIIPTTVLVTGGTSGIGRELAKLFVRDGYNVVIVARNKDHLIETTEELRKLGSGTISYFECDLGQHDAAQELANKLHTNGINIDILVNNAGLGKFESVIEQDIESITSMLHVNITSFTLLTRLLVPRMLLRGWGKVLNVASIVAYYPGPFQAIYNASKSYVLSFSNALAVELQNTPVSVTAMCPGVTQTNFFNKAGADSSKVFSTPGMSMSSEETALLGYQALFRGETQYICGVKNWGLSKMFNFTPSLVSSRIASYLHRSWM